MISSVPDHIAVWSSRPSGAPVSDVGDQVSVAGSKMAPVLVYPSPNKPPQRIMRSPVQVMVKDDRGAGLNAPVGSHDAFDGENRAPVLRVSQFGPTMSQ